MKIDIPNESKIIRLRSQDRFILDLRALAPTPFGKTANIISRSLDTWNIYKLVYLLPLSQEYIIIETSN
jgi:hypothetical protein